MMSKRVRKFMQWVSLATVLVFGAGAAGAQTLAYVTNGGSNDVYVIDTSSNTVIATVPVGSPTSAAAGTPDGAFVYVTHNSLLVSVIATATNTVVATVPLGVGGDDSVASDVAITSDGAFAYVATNDCLAFNCTVALVKIDTATNSVVTTIPIPVTDRLRAVAITPNGAFAYATAGTAGTIVIDTATNTVTTTIPGFAGDIAITPNGAFAYVTANLFNRVSVIDTATNTVAATIPVPLPSRVAIAPNGTFAYVTQSGAGSAVTVIDTATNTPVATTGIGPAGATAVTPDSAFLYFAQTSTVSAIDTATNTVIATIPAGVFPSDIAIVAPSPAGPTSADQCKDGGWMTFTNPSFRNQGDCVSYVNHLP